LRLQVLLLELLREAAATHEKLLLFSQSLVVLELIERILHKSGRWKVRVIDSLVAMNLCVAYNLLN